MRVFFYRCRPAVFAPRARGVLWQLVLCSGVVAGCSFFSPPVVLKIGSQQWTQKQFALLLLQKIKDTSLAGRLDIETTEHVKEQLIADLLIKHLIEQRAKRQRVVVSKAQVKARLLQLQKSYSHPSAFAVYLSERNISQKEWEQSVQYNLLAQKVMDNMGRGLPPPSAQELKAFYQKHLEDFKKKAKVKVRFIFDVQKEAVMRAEWLLKEGENFKTLARRFSKAPQKENPLWAEKGMLDVFDQAFLLKKNQISPVLSGRHGWYIIQLLDKKPAQTLSFKSVKALIALKLMNQRKKARFAKWLDEQGKKTIVWRNSELIKNIKVL